MRKFILLVVLVAFQFGTAQEKNEENKKSNVNATFYIGVNGHIQDNLNLNKNTIKDTFKKYLGFYKKIILN
jgi:hypothetical protein